MQYRCRIRIDIVAIISLLLVIFVALFTVSFSAGSLTEQDTTVQRATISNITVRNDHALIYTEEFSYPLLIAEEIYTRLDNTKIEYLKSEDILVFQTETAKEETLKNGPFIPIVSLLVNDLTMFSLSDYNACMQSAIKPARIACVIVCVVLAFILLCLTVKKRLKNRHH